MQNSGQKTLTLAQALDHLRADFIEKRRFLFFTGTVRNYRSRVAFACSAIFRPYRKRETSSAIAHYIAGVLDREMMVEIVESLSETAAWKVGACQKLCGHDL